MKENILGFFFTGQKMNIIDDQNINHLVKMNKIVLVITTYGIDKLLGKLLGSYIQNRFLRKIVFNL